MIGDELFDVSDIINNCETYYAHLSIDGKEKETLQEHTQRCQKYWTQIVEKKHLESIFKKFEQLYLKGVGESAKTLFQCMTENIVTMHDIGKVNPCFQQDKMKHSVEACVIPDRNIGSKHSILSAVFYLDYFIKKINKIEEKTDRELLKDFVYIYSYIISRHHGKLTDLEQYLDGLSDKSSKGEGLGARARQWLMLWKQEVMHSDEEMSVIRTRWNRYSGTMFVRMDEREISQTIYLYAWTRLLYSLLTAADYYATSEFMNGMEITEYGEINRYEHIIRRYEDGNILKMIRKYEQTAYLQKDKNLEKVEDINILRTELFLDAETNAKRRIKDSIFYLEAPTGSGKSNTAMNLSFTFMKENPEIRKIFYIYPFNTLVEQNMNILEKTFEGDEKILSQIAVVNSLVPFKEPQEEEDSIKKYQEMLLDRQFMNYPIVLSTHVMLFRMMFGNRREDMFGFHQLSHSVIVLDEIQSYSSELWKNIILFLKAYAELLDLKIIIMSATLPNLEVLTDNQSPAVKLISNPRKYFGHTIFRDRVDLRYELLEKKITLEELEFHVQKNVGRKVLIEFIKKSTAEEFYRMIEKKNKGICFLMTGDSSIRDRKMIISKIEKMKSVILVATQVIEAGVDIDMDVGYKDISRLDSEEQFMGRINRSGKKTGYVYFFDLDDAHQIYKDIRSSKEYSLLNDEMRQILCTKNFAFYYENCILPVLKKNGDNFNNNNRSHFFKKKVGHLNMPEVADTMKLIEKRKMVSLYLGHKVVQEDGNVLDGKEVWKKYKELLLDGQMRYEEKVVKLHKIRTQMSEFIYQFSDSVKFCGDEQIGDLVYISDGESYFDENNLLIRELFKENTDLFI